MCFRSNASKKRSCAALSTHFPPDTSPPRHTPKLGHSAPRQTSIVRYNKFTIDPSAIQGFCVNPLYLFRERVEKILLVARPSQAARCVDRRLHGGERNGVADVRIHLRRGNGKAGKLNDGSLRPRILKALWRSFRSRRSWQVRSQP